MHCIEDSSLPPDAILRFVVISNSTVTPGSIQKAFIDAHSVDAAQKALTYAKHTILHTSTKDPDIDIYANLPKSYRDYIIYLFDDTRSQIVCNIIKSIEIEIHNDTYNEALLLRFRNQPGLPSEYLDLLLTDMFGWVTKTVLSFTQRRCATAIPKTSLRRARWAICFARVDAQRN